MITADFSQVAALAADLAAAGLVVKAASDVVVGEGADRIRDDASQRSPVLTGELAASWYVIDADDGKIVTSDARQAFYMEFGTTRHGPQPSLFPAAERGADRMALELEVVASEIL